MIKKIGFTAVLVLCFGFFTLGMASEAMPMVEKTGSGDAAFTLTLPEGRYMVCASEQAGSFFSVTAEDDAIGVFAFGGGTRWDVIRNAAIYSCSDMNVSVSASGEWAVRLYDLDAIDATPQAGNAVHGALACYEGTGTQVIYGIKLPSGSYSAYFEMKDEGAVWIYGANSLNMPLAQKGDYLFPFGGDLRDPLAPVAFDCVPVIVECYDQPINWRLTVLPQ